VGKHQGQLELTWTDKDKALLPTGDGKYDDTFTDPADYRVSEVLSGRTDSSVRGDSAPFPLHHSVALR
jgi:hypothetical protein